MLNSDSHLDRLLGTDLYRRGKMDTTDLLKYYAYDLSDFMKERSQYFLYRL